MTNISYDSGDPIVQLRCQLFSTMSDPVMQLVEASFLFFAIVRPVSSVSIIGMGATIFIAVLIILGFSVYSRSRGPRLCTTSTAEDGLRDVTPNSDNTYPWQKIRRITTRRGDVYFFIKPSGCVFVPRCAFSSDEESFQFYEESKDLWSARRALPR